MKKLLVLFFIMMHPINAFCDMDKYTQIQMLRAQIETLQKTRSEKYDTLTECERSAKKFKIAGISTVSAASIGFAVNIALQKQLSALDAASSGGAGVNDARSEMQKCDDTVDMFCNSGLPTYDADICKELSSGCA